jgi:uncharacterized protein YcfL
MNKGVMSILVLVIISLFLLGCSSNKGIPENQVKCPALCMSLCEANGMVYSPSEQSIETTKCTIECKCSKIITYDFITKQ